MEEQKSLTMAQTIAQMHKLLGDAALLVENISIDRVKDCVSLFDQLIDVTKQLEDIADTSKSLRSRMSEDKLPKMFESLGIDSFKANGKTFTPSVRLHASLNLDKKGLWPPSIGRYQLYF